MSFDIPREPGARKDLPAFLPALAPGGRLAFWHDVGPDEARLLLARSSTEVKDKNSDALAMSWLQDSLVGGNFDANGDSVVLDRGARVLEGLKRLRAIVETGCAARLLLVYGVDDEARFSTDSWLRKSSARKAVHPSDASPMPVNTVDLAQVPDAIRRDAQGALLLRDEISRSLDYDVLTHWTAETLVASAARVPPASALGVPPHVGLFLHACVAEVAPREVDAFFAAWADPSLEPCSAPALLTRSPHRRNPLDMHALARACARAVEAFVSGEARDPYLIGSPRRGGQLLQVLVGHPGRLADAQLTCSEETIEVEELRSILAAAGRPVESLSRKDMTRLEPLLFDLRRDKALVLTGQTVKLTAGNHLIDGFDLFSACVLEGVPYRGFVVRGFREGFKHLRRQGRRQSLGHRIYADGGQQPYCVQSSMGMTHCVTENDRNVVASTTTERKLQREHPQVQRAVMFANPLKRDYKLWMSGLVPAYLCLSRYSRDLADSFVSELKTVMDGKGDMSLARHRVLEKLGDALLALGGTATDGARRGGPDSGDEAEGGDELQPGERNRRDLTYSYCIEAMNAWCRETEIEAFSPLPEKGYVKLLEPPQVKALYERLRREAALKVAEA